MKDILTKTRLSPHKRLQYIYTLAKVKRTCDGGDAMNKKFDMSAAEEDTKIVLKLLYFIYYYCFLEPWWVWSAST